MVNVIFNTAFIGDLILSIPLIRYTKRRFPNEPLILICRKGVGEIFLKNKLVDQVIELDKKSSQSISSAVTKLNEMGVHNLICAHQSFRSAWIVRGIKAREKVGYKKFWNFPFFNRRIERRMNLPEPLRVLDLLSPLSPEVSEIMTDSELMSGLANISKLSTVIDWPTEIPESLRISLQSGALDIDQTFARLNIKKPFVVIAPSSQWPTKRWHSSGFVDLIQGLVQLGRNVYLVGAASEHEVCEEILVAAQKSISRKDGSMAGVYSLVGITSLFDLQCLFTRAELAICNDSGPMHIASASGAKVIAIFGPTTLALGYRPWSDRAKVIQRELDCRPCGKHGHLKCPIKTHACMREISAEEVIKVVKDTLIQSK